MARPTRSEPPRLPPTTTTPTGPIFLCRFCCSFSWLGCWCWFRPPGNGWLMVLKNYLWIAGSAAIATCRLRSLRKSRRRRRRRRRYELCCRRRWLFLGVCVALTPLLSLLPFLGMCPPNRLRRRYIALPTCLLSLRVLCRCGVLVVVAVCPG